MYGEDSFAAVWACDTEAGKILHLGPQLGITVNIDMVDYFMLGLGLTVRAGNGHVPVFLLNVRPIRYSIPQGNEVRQEIVTRFMTNLVFKCSSYIYTLIIWRSAAYDIIETP